MINYYYFLDIPKKSQFDHWHKLFTGCGFGEQIGRENAEVLDSLDLKGKGKDGEEVDCPYKVVGKNLAVFSLLGQRLVAKAGVDLKSNGEFHVMVLCGESLAARNAGKNMMHHIFNKLGKDCGLDDVNQEGQLISTNNPFYDKLEYLEQTIVDSDDEDRAVYEGIPKLNSPAAMAEEYPEVELRSVATGAGSRKNCIDNLSTKHISRVGLRKSYDRGIGAHKTNPSSVRNLQGKKGVGGIKMSKEQWGCARAKKLSKLGEKAGYDGDLLKGAGYKIKEHTKRQAKKLGVEVKPSQLKNKKIDVFRGGKKIASVGHPDYKDYPTFLQDCSKKVADARRELYKKRHEKTRHKKDTPSYYADKLLW